MTNIVNEPATSSQATANDGEPLEFHLAPHGTAFALCGKLIPLETTVQASGTAEAMDMGTICPLCELERDMLASEGHYMGLTVSQSKQRDMFTVFVLTFAKASMNEYVHAVEDVSLCSRICEGNISISDVERLAQYARVDTMALMALFAQKISTNNKE
ncbi:hypothetical protein [Alloscardovia macacae]|uniref:Uncharacterized protein n=1 Tax=Alloscardovia macacae TaxID=1160091 RepID=A0A261F4M2_9BIFI|nr:hypothetical protein [Alloscardovia macacae]OZG54062.1 hypothetical protein ALMA_1026 [Alloscardovia macacae]